MSSALRDALARLLGTPVDALQGIAGGDINHAYQATFGAGQRVFVKTHPRPPAGAYACEAEGLVWLREPGALRVPEVLAVSEQLLVLEWIDSGARGRDFDERFGRGLAQLHRAGAPGFGFVGGSAAGFAGAGYLANLPLDNRPRATWPAFYAEQRLLPLGLRARDEGWLSASALARIEALCGRLAGLCGETEPPSRLHGDLWSGNVMVDARGAPVLVDPAVYGGEREVDLAMLRLFGAPSARFFAAYAEVYPLKPGIEERVALYQLLPLLVHVCLFGGGYVAQLERALARYA